ncbi:mCG145345, partial [Mus musculus]
EKQLSRANESPLPPILVFIVYRGFPNLHYLLTGLDGISTYRGKYSHPDGVLGPLFIHQKRERERKERREERKMDLLTRL